MRTLDSFRHLDYPTDQFQVHVVADNCTDRTDERPARRRGFNVHVRIDPAEPGKGPALNWLYDRLQAGGEQFDTVLIVDADTTLRADFLRHMAAALDGGVRELRNFTAFMTPMFRLPRALRLGCSRLPSQPPPARSNGNRGVERSLRKWMAFDRELMDGRRWSGHLTEDMEFQMDLLLDGHRVAYVPGAVLEAEMPHNLGSATSQNERWELGRQQMARRYIPPLTRRLVSGPGELRTAYADAIFDHLVPPLSVLIAANIVCGFGGSGDDGGAWTAHRSPEPAVECTVGDRHRRPRGRGPAFGRCATQRLPRLAARAEADRVEDQALVAGSDPAELGHLDKNYPKRGNHMTPGYVPRPPALLFGVPIDDLTMDETVAAIGELVADGRRHGRTHQVATVNVDFLVNALADDGVHQLLQNADVCLADGAPVVWGARAARMKLRERVAGADLVPALAKHSAGAGWRIHLFGSAPGTAERAAELLTARYPWAHVTGDSGPFIKDAGQVDEDLLASLAAADPDILCVALGNPKQEKFIEAYRGRLGAPVMIGIGGTLDFIVGGRRRAPRVDAARRSGMGGPSRPRTWPVGQEICPRRRGVLPPPRTLPTPDPSIPDRRGLPVV